MKGENSNIRSNDHLQLYYKSSTPMKKVSRLNYLSPYVYRSLYLMKLSPIHGVTEKKVYSRGSAIPKAYENLEVDIYRGNKFVIKRISRWSLGFRFGEFTWNKKVAMFKSKQKKKKK